MIIFTALVFAPTLVFPAIPRMVPKSTTLSNLTFKATACDTKQSIAIKCQCTKEVLNKPEQRAFEVKWTLEFEGNSSAYVFLYNHRNWPMSCKHVGAVDDEEGFNGLILTMLQPLWPAKTSSSSWVVSIPNPMEPKQNMQVKCSAQKGQANALLIREKSGKLDMGGGKSIEITTDLTVDSLNGKLLSGHADLTVYVGKAKAQLMSVDEKA